MGTTIPLIHWHPRDESQKLIDYDGLRKKLVHDNAGTKALAWLLKTAKYETLDSTSHPIFMQATASCIVGEGKIDFWWDMITIRHVPKLLEDKTVSDMKYSQNRWSSLLILSLLEGQKFWPKEGNSMNGCLATFLKVVRFNNRQSSPKDRITWLAAHSWLGKRLPFYSSIEERRNINVKDYDAYIDQVRLFRANYHSKAHLIAEERMQFVTSIAEGKFRLLIRHLVYHCHNTRHAADVEWVIDFYSRIQHQRSKSNDQYNTWRRIARKATDDEIARGIPVDANGYIFSQSRDWKWTIEEVQEHQKKLRPKPHKD
jgi:hypothetical protein